MVKANALGNGKKSNNSSPGGKSGLNWPLWLEMSQFRSFVVKTIPCFFGQNRPRSSQSVAGNGRASASISNREGPKHETDLKSKAPRGHVLLASPNYEFAQKGQLLKPSLSLSIGK